MRFTAEPRLLLLGGNRGFWHAKDRLHDAPTMTGIESWVFACDGDYREGVAADSKLLDQYDIVITNYNHSDTIKLIRLQQSRKKDLKWVTLIEEDAVGYLKPQPYMRELLDHSDLVICINHFSESFFKRLTSAPVKYLGLPYPAEGIRALMTPIPERRKEIFLAPILLTRWNEYFCVKDLGITFYGYERRLSRSKKTIIKNFREYKTLDPLYLYRKARLLYKEPALRIERQVSLPKFFRHNGGAYVWLNLDHRYTWARYVLDAAALQVPIITTRSTGHAEHFFPDTMVHDEFDVDRSRELLLRLFKDEDFYRSVSAVPLEKFDHLRPDVKKKELFDALYSSEKHV